MRTDYLGRLWRRWSEVAIPLDMAARDKVVVRRAFYAGMRSFSAAVDANMTPGMSEAALEKLYEEFEAELRDFENLVKVGRA